MRRSLSFLLILAAFAAGCDRSSETESTADVPLLGEAPAHRTILQQWAVAPDPDYAWEEVGVHQDDDVSAHVLEMTSGSWLTPEEVDRPLWKHWLTVHVPDGEVAAIGFLYITGGDNEDPAPEGPDPRFAEMARATGTAVAELRMVPNQPLTFTGDPGNPRYEDALIAYGWDKYLRGGREEWLARLPMTRSAVRAMDTVSDLLARQDEAVEQFVVAGGSKRGWTTWTTAIVDHRVVAIVPLVIDLLNVKQSFYHHYSAYGFWAPAVQDYVDMGIMNWMGNERYDQLNLLVEPFSYKEVLTLPKFMINAAGDQFFLPDSSQFYFDQLVGEKHLRYVPNVGHSLGGSDAFDSLLAFYDDVVDGRERPNLVWKRTDRGLQVTVEGDREPTQVLLWQATNYEARDFRIDVLGEAYDSEELVANEDGSWSADVSEPETGWTAFFVEATFDSEVGVPIKLTTEVRVLPETLPFSPPPATMSVAGPAASAN